MSSEMKFGIAFIALCLLSVPAVMIVNANSPELPSNPAIDTCVYDCMHSGTLTNLQMIPYVQYQCYKICKGKISEQQLKSTK